MKKEENFDKGNQKQEDLNFGFFAMLGINFNSTFQQIERNYNQILRLYPQTIQSSPEQQMDISKIEAAYQLVKNQETKAEYLHNLIIRSYLSQPFEILGLQSSKKETLKLFPFFIFEVIKEGSSEANILTLNFVTQTISESIKEVRIKAFLFSNISSALYSKKDDEFIINFVDNGKILSQNYKAKFINQRDQIVKLFIFAKEMFEGISINLFKKKKETKPTLEFHNPNTKQDLTLFKIQHFSIGENSRNAQTKVSNSFYDQSSTSTLFFWNDSIIPHQSLFKGSAVKLNQKKITFFTVGKNQIILSRDEEVKQIVQVIPLKKEYIAFNRDENCVTIQVLDKTRKYKFVDKQVASALLHCLMTVLNQKAQMPNIVLSFPFIEAIQSSSKIKVQSLTIVNKQINQLELQLSELKLKKQQILSELLEDEKLMEDDQQIPMTQKLPNNQLIQLQKKPSPDRTVFQKPLRIDDNQ